MSIERRCCRFSEPGPLSHLLVYVLTSFSYHRCCVQACFNEALRTCAEGGGRFERAASFLEEMREAGLDPDGASYSAVLRACER